MLTVFACVLLTSTAPTWTLAKGGKSDYSIVVAPGGSPSMRHGAEELQRYITQIAGVRLPILYPEAGWTDGPKKTIVVADDAVLADRQRRKPLGPEEYRISTRPEGILISGDSKRGAMYGCYAFLEDVLGVRWFNTRVTKVPVRKLLQVPALDLRSKPAFEYREPFFTEAFDRDWAARNRVNGNAQRLDAAVGGKVSYGVFVHTFQDLVPPDTYFDQHPEYFSMIDGQRRKGYYQLCLTNPDIVAISVAKVKEWIKQNPEATIFSVSQNDTYNNCQCPECKAVEAEEGAPSGALLRFVNRVAEEIEKDHPNVLIDTLAYQWSEKPPLKVKPRKNVRVRIALIGACYSHPLDGCTENSQPFQNLRDWAKITDQIYIWHYTTNFANYLQPLPNLDEIARDVLLFKENGTVGFFDEGGYAPGGGSEMAELKSYLLAKLMWDPKRAAKPIIDEYLVGVYGKATPCIQAWIDLIHASGRAMKSHARIYDPPTAPYLDDAVLQKGESLFNEAERLVANNKKVLDEVQRARLALEYVQLMRTDAKDASYAAKAKKVADKVKKYGIGQIREGEPVENFLKRIGQQ